MDLWPGLWDAGRGLAGRGLADHSKRPMVVYMVACMLAYIFACMGLGPRALGQMTAGFLYLVLRGTLQGHRADKRVSDDWVSDEQSPTFLAIVMDISWP